MDEARVFCLRHRGDGKRVRQRRKLEKVTPEDKVSSDVKRKGEKRARQEDELEGDKARKEDLGSGVEAEEGNGCLWEDDSEEDLEASFCQAKAIQADWEGSAEAPVCCAETIRQDFEGEAEAPHKVEVVNKEVNGTEEAPLRKTEAVQKDWEETAKTRHSQAGAAQNQKIGPVPNEVWRDRGGNQKAAYLRSDFKGDGVEEEIERDQGGCEKAFCSQGVIQQDVAKDEVERKGTFDRQTVDFRSVHRRNRSERQGIKAPCCKILVQKRSERDAGGHDIDVTVLHDCERKASETAVHEENGSTGVVQKNMESDEGVCDADVDFSLARKRERSGRGKTRAGTRAAEFPEMPCPKGAVTPLTSDAILRKNIGSEGMSALKHRRMQCSESSDSSDTAVSNKKGGEGRDSLTENLSSCAEGCKKHHQGKEALTCRERLEVHTDQHLKASKQSTTVAERRKERNESKKETAAVRLKVNVDQRLKTSMLSDTVAQRRKESNESKKETAVEQDLASCRSVGKRADPYPPISRSSNTVNPYLLMPRSSDMVDPYLPMSRSSDAMDPYLPMSKSSDKVDPYPSTARSSKTVDPYPLLSRSRTTSAEDRKESSSRQAFKENINHQSRRSRIAFHADEPKSVKCAQGFSKDSSGGKGAEDSDRSRTSSTWTSCSEGAPEHRNWYCECGTDHKRILPFHLSPMGKKKY